MTRKLTSDERALWDELRRSVRPLHRARPKPAPAAAPPVASETAGPPKAPKKVARANGAAALPKPAAAPPVQPLAPLETRARRRLDRGLVEIDDRIDLHGMVQERAFHALIAFLRRAQARGDRIVLVITGRGRASESGRGILREAVPGWLARPDMRPFVVGFEEAGRRHGGAGALYVRIRRRREAGHPAPRA